MKTDRLIYEPAILIMLSKVFESIASRSWFPPDEDARRELGRHILATYERGMVDRERLRSFCMTAAIHKFLLGGPVALTKSRILVVEDDFFCARDLAQLITAHGAKVIGPVSHVEEALQLLSHSSLPPTSAILDIRLSDGDAFPVADQLDVQAIPFAFLTAFDDGIPARHQAACRFSKPINDVEVTRFLSTEDDAFSR